MPSDQSTWLIGIPQDGDSEIALDELTKSLEQQVKHSRRNISGLKIPSFKTGTLDILISLSEDLPKQDAYFTSTVAKTVDTLRNLLNNDPSKLSQHILVNENPVDSYVLQDWKWNEGRYSIHKSPQELVLQLNKEMASLDNVMKAKLNNYNLVKGALVQMQRKKTGNLSVRSLADIVSKDDVVQGSEYMETLLVAVPKSLVKEWGLKYERLAEMVVPRSSKLVASDDEFSLFSVIIFKRTRDVFVQKCRENKFIVRDFSYSDELIIRQQAELDTANVTEKELWTELLRLSRINFSEAFQLLMHLKVLRLFVESVLRYGLPAEYTGIIIKPESKSTGKILSVLSNQFQYLAPRSNTSKKSKGSELNSDLLGEYQTVMEQEFFDFVLFEVPWVIY